VDRESVLKQLLSSSAACTDYCNVVSGGGSIKNPDTMTQLAAVLCPVSCGLCV
jgi:hypothetical protein